MSNGIKKNNIQGSYKEIKVRENPTPATANTYKQSFADIVSGQNINSPGPSTQVAAKPVNIIIDNSKEKNLIIMLTKLIEDMSLKNSPGNNDELLINIGKHLQDFWKVNTPSQPVTSNGPN